MDEENLLYVHKGILLSQRNNDMCFEGKWMQLEHIMVSEVSQAQKDKGHIFFHKWKIDPKDKNIHKNKHDHIQTHM
jgi:hypothetical protein